MIHVGRRSYPYMEEVNEGLVRELRRASRTSAAQGRILDVGCGRGQLGEAARALGWEVWGVESSDEACDAAERRLDRVIRADLNDQDGVRRATEGTSFDGLVFSDVLEHLYDPRTVLERYLELARPGAYVFVSVPNAVAWTNRLQWAVGNVRYDDTGIMDRTHVRFFTFATAKELVEASGCTVERVSSTPYLVRAVLPAVKGLAKGRGSAAPDPRGIIDSSAYRAYMRFLYPMERAVAAIWPELLAFRIIVVARKGAGATG